MRFVARDLQIGRGLGMMRLQGERAFVIQNRASKIARAEVGVAEIIKHIRTPLPGANQCLVARDRFLEMTLGVFLVCLCKFDICLTQY